MCRGGVGERMPTSDASVSAKLVASWLGLNCQNRSSCGGNGVPQCEVDESFRRGVGDDTASRYFELRIWVIGEEEEWGKYVLTSVEEANRKVNAASSEGRLFDTTYLHQYLKCRRGLTWIAFLFPLDFPGSGPSSNVAFTSAFTYVTEHVSSATQEA